MNFIDKRLSIKRAMALLAKNGILVNENEAGLILEFLYLIASTHPKPDADYSTSILKERSNQEKTHL